MAQQEIHKFYDELGLETLPIPQGQKFPPAPGWQTKPVEELWKNAPKSCNIAIRLGPKKLADFESDDLVSESFISKRLDELGLHDIPKCKSKRGWHHFVRVDSVPEYIDIKNWKSSIGKGEARFRNCYSLIPDSQVDDHRYFWEGDSYIRFGDLPTIHWSDIAHYTTYNDNLSSTIFNPLPRYFKTNVEPWVFSTLDILKNHPKGHYLRCDKHSWSSRSEAEFAVITRLDSCGYSFDEIHSIFEKYSPGHYIEYGNHRKEYLENTLHNVWNLKIRPALCKYHNTINGNSQPDKILRVLVSIAHQLNTLEFFCSYGQLATYIGIDPNSKLGPKKSCISLENRGIITIKKGTMRMEGIRGKSTTFSLSSKILETN